MTKEEIKKEKQNKIFPNWILWVSLIFVVIYGLVNNLSALLKHITSEPYEFPIGYTTILFFLWFLYIIPSRSIWHNIKNTKAKIGTPVWILWLVLIGYVIFETILIFDVILEFFDDIFVGIFFVIILLIIYFFILVVPAFCIWKEIQYSRKTTQHKVHIVDKIILSIALLWFLFIVISNLVIGWGIISAINFVGLRIDFVNYYYMSSTNLLWFFGFIL